VAEEKGKNTKSAKTSAVMEKERGTGEGNVAIEGGLRVKNKSPGMNSSKKRSRDDLVKRKNVIRGGGTPVGKHPES